MAEYLSKFTNFFGLWASPLPIYHDFYGKYLLGNTLLPHIALIGRNL